MQDIIAQIQDWGERTPVVVATVTQTWGSAPRQMGAKLAFTPDLRIAGSVSGGCIEPAVIEAGQGILQTGAPRLLRFGVADETAFDAVGLACGGSIEVFVEPLSQPLRQFWLAAARHSRPAASVTVLDGDHAGAKLLLDEDGGWQMTHPPTALPAPAQLLLPLARAALRDGRTSRQNLPEVGEVLMEAITPPPALILIGGAHIAVALAPMAKQLGYHVTVIDPREAFGNRQRFPSADQILNSWPQLALSQIPITRSTALVALTHNENIDDPALKMALRSKAFYVGALGGKVTREKRLARLRAAGFGDAELARLHQPIGLEIGARAPEEIALATMAQIVRQRNAPA